mmetsp:Transcript_58508/g.96561  ORF Transcript_58508/g.96561 Transcript_58508/m.96561 type:complete len:163 (+) Transcript_58508:30-518(+)
MAVRTRGALLAAFLVVMFLSVTFLISWPTFFVISGLSNMAQCVAHFVLLGGVKAKIHPPLGWMPEGPPDYGRAAGNLHGDANSIWVFVGVAGFAYASHGLFSWMGFWWMTVWGLCKWLVAAACLKIIRSGKPGWATAPVALLETVLGSMFLYRSWTTYGPLA